MSTAINQPKNLAVIAAEHGVDVAAVCPLYLISEYQKTYFVMKDFDSLSSLTPERILRIVQTAQRLPHHCWTELVPGDEVFNIGHAYTSPNEKYYRLAAGQKLDDCQRRTAVRNLKLWSQGIEANSDALAASFLSLLPKCPKLDG